MTLKLRRPQRLAIDAILSDFYSGTNRLAVQMPTGIGKTILFSALPEEMKFSEDDWMLVLVHRDKLAKQAARQLKRINPNRTVGIEMGKHIALNSRLVVASVQTVGKQGSRRLAALAHRKAPRAIIIDECHHAITDGYKTILNAFNVFADPTILVMGVTATVNRADKRGLGEVFQKISYSYSMLEGVRDGYLAEPRGKLISLKADLDSVKRKGKDFDPDDLSRVLNTPSVNRAVVDGWEAECRQAKSIFFATNIQHCKDLAAEFRSRGYRFEAVWGVDPDRDRKLDDHFNNRIQGLVNADLLVEGYDDWSITCVGIVRNTQSEGRYVQAVGRGCRIEDGVENINDLKRLGQFVAKDHCVILDYVGNSKKHSLVTLPSLFGLSPRMDMKGRSVLDIAREIEEIKKKNPVIDLSQVEDVTQLKAYAESVDLFKVNFAPEVVALSEFQWHKTGDNAYVLLLKDDESLVAIKNLLDRWRLVGSIKGGKIDKELNSFEDAIREGDYQVEIQGGRSVVAGVKRSAAWHAEKPTSSQLMMCKKMKITVPPNATKGEVSMKLNEAIGKEKLEKKLKDRRIA